MRPGLPLSSLAAAALLTAVAAGCRDPAPRAPLGEAARPLLQAFPSRELMNGDVVEIPEGALPQADGGTPFPVHRVNGRSGFSPVQTSVVALDVALDPDSLPAPFTFGGSVQLWDETTGEELPAWVELDAFPDQNPTPALLVRPMRPVEAGHEVLVVLTDSVQTSTGDPLQVAWFEVAAAGGAVTGAHNDSADVATSLPERCAALGIDRAALAFSFPVGDATGPTRHVAAHAPLPTTWALDQVDVAETPGELGDGTWIHARGTFSTTGWLDEGGQLAFDAAGDPTPGAPWTADLLILVPESLRGADPASAPVWQFGHGIFSSPTNYLGDASDPSSVIALADRAGAVLVATSWPGLTTSDVSIPLEVAADFGRFPRLSDRLVQAVGNQVALSRLLVEGDLLDDPALHGRVDRSALDHGLPWYGISLGGIAGAVTAANNPHLGAAVFHVGGSSWSTMLERSDTWSLFEDLMKTGVPNPTDRQLLISASQLFWDPVDPAAYAADLVGGPYLWQQSLGDERVPNLTTEALARGADAAVVAGPTHAVPWGFVVEDAPAAPALVLLDPEVALPPDQNRPPPTTGAHEAPRHWPGVHSQIIRFLDTRDPGVIAHFCGEAPCSASNPGE